MERILLIARGNIDSGQALELAIVTFAVGLVTLTVFTLLPEVSPVNQWFSSSGRIPDASQPKPMVQALVSPIYPLFVLVVCAIAWWYYYSQISSDWMNPAEAGAALDSARVDARAGLESSHKSFWAARAAMVDKIRNLGTNAADHITSSVLNCIDRMSEAATYYWTRWRGEAKRKAD